MKKIGWKRAIALLLAALFCIGSAPLPVAAAHAVQETQEIRGVWIASTYNIDFPQKGSDTASMKKQLRDILDTAAAAGLNTVFFQVRPTCDALYPSELFPWSDTLTGEQGVAPEDGFDPLAYIIEEGKKRNIAIHAWINPYRVAQGTPESPAVLSALSLENPARKNPDLVIPYADGKLYLDPGNPATTELVLAGVAEIVRNYDVAGIQFDDYFYPHTTVTEDGRSTVAEFDDSASYAAYGNGMDRADWRRQNTYQLICRTYETIKARRKDVMFGVSPSGIWRNAASDPLGSNTAGGESYEKYYADTRSWVKDGIVDYIAPQLYWYVGQKGSDFEVLARWWADVCAGTDVKLLIGHAAYKLGTADAWNESEIPRQIALAREVGAAGSIFYGYSKLADNTQNLRARLAALYGAEESEEDEIRPLVIALPSASIYPCSYQKIYFLGTADPRFPVYLDGKELPRSESGHFWAYQALASGKNVFTFTFRDTVKTVTVGSDVAAPVIPYVMGAPSFKPGSLTPASAQILQPGDVITLSCVAPDGVSVNARIGDTVIALARTGAQIASAGLSTATYSAQYRIPDNHTSGIQNLGAPVYSFVYGGKTYSAAAAGTVSSYASGARTVATVTAHETLTRDGPSSGYQKLSPLAQGVQDYVVRQSGSYCKLRSGQWVPLTALSTQVALLPDNAIRGEQLKNLGAHSELRFRMNYFAPYETAMDESKFTIRFFDSDGTAAPEIPTDDPLFAWASFRQDGDDAVYTFYLKERGAFTGYTAERTGNSVCFTVKNPTGIAQGEKPLAGKKIVLDAGHGGSDIGAVVPLGAQEGTESALNLALAQAVERQLRTLGAEVMMLRDDDSYLSLDARALAMKQENPDLAISLHHNSLALSSNISTAEGHLVLYREDFSKTFAKTMSDALGKGLPDRRNRGAAEQGLAVCYIMECPSILIEMGFISNPYEYEKLSTEFDREAAAIADGVVNFLREH